MIKERLTFRKVQNKTHGFVLLTSCDVEVWYNSECYWAGCASWYQDQPPTREDFQVENSSVPADHILLSFCSIRPFNRTTTTIIIIIGCPFVKWLAVCYQTIACLPVWDVGVLWPQSSMDQDEIWHVGRPQPWPHCLTWDPAPTPPKGHSPHPSFRPISVVAQRLDGSRCHLVWM